MGRHAAPPGTRRRDHARAGRGARVEVELTAEEATRLDANRGGMTRAAYIRSLILSAPVSAPER